MRPLLSLALAGSFLTLGCKSTDNSTEQHSVSHAKNPAEPAASAEPEIAAAEELHVRALFYYERKGPTGVKAYPDSGEHSARSEGEKAWLEVHTSGAAHAYAFAVFPDGHIDTLWTEAIAKKKHTPPMNAFENGLPLTEQFVADTSVLVVASLAPIEGVDELTDCASNPSGACIQIAEILQKNTPAAAPTSTLRMRHMETETAAFGSMNSGTTLSAVSFPVIGR